MTIQDQEPKIMIGLGVVAIFIYSLIIISIIFKEDKSEEMPYCEKLDYQIENSKLLKRTEVLLLEKMVAIQSGECNYSN
jgi:hypothetical protein